MNITEANACSTLLRYAAGVFLAGRIRKTLSAGPDPDDVAAALTTKATAVADAVGRGWDGPGLPTFEDIRARAYAVLGDAADWLRSDWRSGAGPTGEAADAVADARAAIAAAKTALNRAAAAMDRR